MCWWVGVSTVIDKYRRQAALCVDIWEFVGRRGSAKCWAVDIEEVIWEAGIIEDEEDKNLPWEGGVARGESVAAAADALSDKDCEFKWSPD